MKITKRPFVLAASPLPSVSLLVLFVFVFVFACGPSQATHRANTEAISKPMAGPEDTVKAVKVADRLEPLARVDGSTFIEILEVKAANNGRLFYCTGVRGLQVVDVSDPAHPTLSHELRSSKYSHGRFARCQHVASEGDRVFFTSRGDMVQKTPFITGYDLSTSPPTEVVNYAATANAESKSVSMTFEGITVSDGRLYAATHEHGLAIMEVDEANKTLRKLGVASGFTSAWSVAVSGNYAYVADAAGSLGVVDVSDPRHPNRVASLETGGSAQSVAVSGNYVYLALGEGGLVVIDISTPTAPRLVSRTDTNGSALQVSIDGSRAYLANWNDARIYDIGDPAKPRLLAAEVVKTEEMSSRVLGMAGAGDTIFVGEWTGLYTYQLHADRVAPHITADRHRVDFDRAGPGQTVTQTLRIENEGSSVLHITSTKTTGSGFATTAQPSSVAPGRSLAVSVSFSPATKEPSKGELILRSNDPDDGELRIPLIGNQRGLAIGDKAPEITLALLDGGQWRLSEQRGKVVLLVYFATF